VKIAGNGLTVADELLQRYSGEWHGDVKRIYSEFSF
jgi:glutamate--cysteine ligase